MTPNTPSPKFKVRKIYSTLLPTLSGIALLIGGVAIGFVIFGNVYESQLYTEIISLIVSIVIIDRIMTWRMTRHTTEQLKVRLLHEARSRSNEIATSAIDWLRDEGWIFGKESLLNHAKLRHANLDRAYLKGTSLINAELQMANLHKAYLVQTDLRYATLQRANLSYAHLMKASLRNADLRRADLSHTNLSGADLRGANFTEARVSHGTILENVVIDANCILPNGTRYEPGTKSVEEQFLYLADEVVPDDVDYELSGIELDDVLLGRVSKFKGRPDSVIHSVMKQIHSLEDEELDELLDQLDMIAHPELHSEDEMFDEPLAFDGHVDELLDDVEDHEFSFLAQIEEELDDDAPQSGIKPATFTEDIHEIMNDLDDTSINFLRNIRQQLQSDPKPTDSDEEPTQLAPPKKRTSDSEGNDKQAYQ